MPLPTYVCSGFVPCLLALIILNCHLFSSVQCDSYSADERLGVAYEFRIHVDPGKEDCFWQQVQPQSSLYVAFQVMRGGDGKAGFAIRSPDGNFALPYTWKENAELDESHVQQGGYYQMCIDNTLSRFASKLVSLYVASFKRDEWEKYIDELNGQDVTVSNFTTSLANVDHNIGVMLKHLDQSRKQMNHDWYIVDSNNSYIQWWSIIQCIVVIVSSLAQLFFVKKLFIDSENQGNQAKQGGFYKPRA
ncbi:Transmembrane emp24 domain-containing protein 6 [Halotydeus destructor]|nr:Transmembrane emp24 domain-containing protein 6 [Halotydeus destructor]